MALEDAGELDTDPRPAGVIYATGVGGLETLQDQIGGPHREGAAPGLAASRADDDGQRRRRGDLDAPRLAGAVRDDRHRLRLGTHAIGNAARLIAIGRCDAVHHRRRRGGDDPGRRARRDRRRGLRAT